MLSILVSDIPVLSVSFNADLDILVIDLNTSAVTAYINACP